MHARMFAALAGAALIGAAACTPAWAQNTMPASASSTMMHPAMHDAMRHPTMHKAAMHQHPAMMKKHSMQHDGMQMQHDDAMQMKMKTHKADNAPASSGG